MNRQTKSEEKIEKLRRQASRNTVLKFSELHKDKQKTSTRTQSLIDAENSRALAKQSKQKMVVRATPIIWRPEEIEFEGQQEDMASKIHLAQNNKQVEADTCADKTIYNQSGVKLHARDTLAKDGKDGEAGEKQHMKDGEGNDKLGADKQGKRKILRTLSGRSILDWDVIQFKEFGLKFQMERKRSSTTLMVQESMKEYCGLNG